MYKARLDHTGQMKRNLSGRGPIEKLHSAIRSSKLWRKETGWLVEAATRRVKQGQETMFSTWSDRCSKSDPSNGIRGFLFGSWGKEYFPE